MSEIDIGYLSYEPNLITANSVATLQQNRAQALMIINNSQRFFTLRKGYPKAKLSEINADKSSSILQIKSMAKTTVSDNFSNINA